MWYFFLVLISFCSPRFREENQDQIRLDNPSFEGMPQDASTPIGWMTCGKNSTPDILPGFWGVYTEPSDGNSYVGLITREDGTWETIGQHLRQPLKASECYTFSVDLARSTTYAGYSIPVKFQLWGAKKKCKREQLLAETSVIKHTDWKTYNFEFTPKNDLEYILIEAKYANGIYVSYKGNLLIDNCKPFKKCLRASIGKLST